MFHVSICIAYASLKELSKKYYGRPKLHKTSVFCNMTFAFVFVALWTWDALESNYDIEIDIGSFTIRATTI